MERFDNNYSGQDRSAADQFRRLSEVIKDEVILDVLTVAPSKPRQGRVVVADGVTWNPLGVGVPRIVWFNGTAWVALNA